LNTLPATSPKRAAYITPIGTRCPAGFVERQDTESGTYEAINSSMVTRAESEIQRVLLLPLPVSIATRVARLFRKPNQEISR
jgi:hypothetical protein